MEKKYELLTVLDPDINEATVVGAVESAIKELEISVDRKDVWGLRTLAYPINSKNRGRYILFELTAANGKNIQDLNRELLITDGVMRFNLVKQEKRGVK